MPAIVHSCGCECTDGRQYCHILGSKLTLALVLSRMRVLFLLAATHGGQADRYAPDAQLRQCRGRQKPVHEGSAIEVNLFEAYYSLKLEVMRNVPPALTAMHGPRAVTATSRCRLRVRVFSARSLGGHQGEQVKRADDLMEWLSARAAPWVTARLAAASYNAPARRSGGSSAAAP